MKKFALLPVLSFFAFSAAAQVVSLDCEDIYSATGVIDNDTAVLSIRTTAKDAVAQSEQPQGLVAQMAAFQDGASKPALVNQDGVVLQKEGDQFVGELEDGGSLILDGNMLWVYGVGRECRSTEE